MLTEMVDANTQTVTIISQTISLDKELKLTFKNGQSFDIKLHPQQSISNDLYNRWIDNNQQRVDERSNKRIAYSYMKKYGRW